MHRYNLKITELSEQDLEEIGDYIAFRLKNPSAAIDIVHESTGNVVVLRILHMLVDSRAKLYQVFEL